MCVVEEGENLGGEGREEDVGVVVFVWGGGDFDDGGGVFVIG